MKIKSILTSLMVLILLITSALTVSAYSVSLTPANPKITDNAVCEISGSGINPNGVDQYLIYFILFRGNTALSTKWDQTKNDGRIHRSFDLDTVGANKGDVLKCRIYKRTASGDITLGTTNTITVQEGDSNSGQNNKNGVARIYPTVANDFDDLICKAEGGNFDPNSNDEKLTYFVWERRTPGNSFSHFATKWDQTEGDQEISSTISAVSTNVGDEWRCKVVYRTASGDYTIDSVTRDIIGNNNPVIDLSSIDPLVFPEDTTQNVDLSALISDADGDALEVTAVGNTNVQVTVDNNLQAVFSSTANWYGTETITLRVDDKNGGIVTDDLTVQVLSVNDAPVLNLPDPIQITYGTTYQIDLDNYVDDADDADNTLAWAISGNTNFAITVDHNRVYNISAVNNFIGSEQVTFNVTDPAGASDQQIVTVTSLDNNIPVVTITAPADNSEYDLTEQINFAATATDIEDGNSLTITWSSTIDGTIGTGDNLDYSSLTAGTHVISASATDSAGATGSDSITITVDEPTTPSDDPLVLTANPQTGLHPLEVRFTVTVNGVLPKTYVYDFGDGAVVVADGQQITHEYLYPGTYNAKVVGFYVDGTSYTAYENVYVNSADTDPEVTIIANPSSGAVPLEVDFRALIENGNAPFQYEWDFDGDGTVDSTKEEPTYKYREEEVYTVRLTITDADNDKITATKTIDTANAIHNLYFGQITFINGEYINAGDILGIAVRVSNDNGDKEKMKITAIIDELGLRAVKGPFDLDQGDETSKTLYLEIPDYAKGEYTVKITISNDNMLRVKYRTIVVQ